MWWGGSRTVHPRVCGERVVVEAVARCRGGSSPRVRGTHAAHNRISAQRRFIPACAGNATAMLAAARSRLVHPRVCGERLWPEPNGWLTYGSSPRVRGTLALGAAVARLPRFIPACAGNAKAIAAPTSASTVHPRVCGERPRRVHRSNDLLRFIPACAGNAKAIVATTKHLAVHPRVCGERRCCARCLRWPIGSSPRVRGTHRDCECEFPLVRFIPACAGNAYDVPMAPATARGSSPRVRGTPASQTSPVSRETVHPRVCGERVLNRLSLNLSYGSSPRVRGTRGLQQRWSHVDRFIPACAGNATEEMSLGVRSGGSSPRVRGTLLNRVSLNLSHRFIPACAGNAAPGRPRRPPAPVHPRVCGERAHRATPIPNPTGSSPRVRGTQRGVRVRDGFVRFIPACAGNAASSRRLCGGPPVHPRVCGERTRHTPSHATHAGSSPRVRGTHTRLHTRPHTRRFIPACAGNALPVTR